MTIYRLWEWLAICLIVPFNTTDYDSILANMCVNAEIFAAKQSSGGSEASVSRSDPLVLYMRRAMNPCLHEFVCVFRIYLSEFLLSMQKATSNVHVQWSAQARYANESYFTAAASTAYCYMFHHIKPSILLIYFAHRIERCTRHFKKEKKKKGTAKLVRTIEHYPGLITSKFHLQID